MKVSAAILISLAHSAPGPNQEPEYFDSKKGGERYIDDLCSELSHDFMIVTQENANNGQSGILTLDKQTAYRDTSGLTSCGQPIGQQCRTGVKIKWNMRFPRGTYNGYAPYIMKANYFQNDESMWTERYYGENNKYTPYNLPREFEVIGKNVKIFIYGNKVQYSLTAHAEIEWECLAFDPADPFSNVWFTNTWQMAQAVLTNDFTPQMAEDYGCAGRGLFDAYGSTIGTVKNEIDTAFLTWKKCVKCATGEDESKIVPYYYNAKWDVCGEVVYYDSLSMQYQTNPRLSENQGLCECDRALMKVLQNAPADTGYSMYPSNECAHPYSKIMYKPLTCCNWNKQVHLTTADNKPLWAAYNPNTSCCSPTGVYPIGTC